MAGAQGPLLQWPLVLALLGIAYLLARGLTRWEPARLPARAVATLVGAWVVHLVLVFQWLDPLWVAHLMSPEGGAGELARRILAVMVAIGFWWRGMSIAADEDPEDVLSNSWRIGIVVLAVAVIVESLFSTSIGARLVVFPFFGATLLGMALSKLNPGAVKKGASWNRVAASATALALIAGLSASFLALGPLHGAFGVALKVTGTVLQWLFMALALPLLFIAQFVIDLVMRLVNFSWRGLNLDLDATNRFLEGMRDQARSPADGSGLWVVALKWVLALFLVLLAFYIIGRAFRGWSGRRTGSPNEQRESVKGEGAPGEELVSLLAGLLGWRTSPKRPLVYPLPSGQDSASRVTRLYLRVLNLMTLWDFPRPVWQTPREYLRTLEAHLPTLPVKHLTEAFSRVRYGLQRPPLEEVEELERSVSAGAVKVPEDRP
ncbi:MAG: DUF4129 domain-containing protein [Chloroflexi bacterium]|nr:DUF4129 domain-containing protein [Chloroflexota bacterium]